MNEWVRNENEVTKNEELYKQQEITFINWIKRKKTLTVFAQRKKKLQKIMRKKKRDNKADKEFQNSLTD